LQGSVNRELLRLLVIVCEPLNSHVIGGKSFAADYADESGSKLLTTKDTKEHKEDLVIVMIGRSES
jgi:hypothetical protein